MKSLPPRSQSHGPAKDRTLANGAVIIHGQRIPLRLLKDHGVTHVVACIPTSPETEPRTITACRGESDVPWSRTSKFKPSKIDCMGCLVALARV